MSAPASSSSSDAQAVAATCAAHALTPADFDALRVAAVAAKKTAYCPYSKFRVGAAVLITSPENKETAIVTGGNVENASYPVGTCAERVALARAVAEGHDTAGFRGIAVATDIAPPASPCGMCRQLCVCSLLFRVAVGVG